MSCPCQLVEKGKVTLTPSAFCSWRRRWRSKSPSHELCTLDFKRFQCLEPQKFHWKWSTLAIFFFNYKIQQETSGWFSRWCRNISNCILANYFPWRFVELQLTDPHDVFCPCNICKGRPLVQSKIWSQTKRSFVSFHKLKGQFSTEACWEEKQIFWKEWIWMGIFVRNLDVKKPSFWEPFLIPGISWVTQPKAFGKRRTRRTKDGMLGEIRNESTTGCWPDMVPSCEFHVGSRKDATTRSSTFEWRT